MNLHDKIVKEVLPRFVERLKAEGIDFTDDRKSFTIYTAEDLPPITIYPDLILHMGGGQKILIEVANPKDPKRFMGELVFPHILGYCKKIDAAIIFVLHFAKKQRSQIRSMVQVVQLYQFLESQTRVMTMSWAEEEEINYHNLKTALVGKKLGILKVPFRKRR